MYQIEYLPSAKNDMVDIIKYISNDLNNPTAAKRLAENFIKSADKLSEFPYANALYFPPKQLRYEYRKLLVQNYIMFYRIDEEHKTVIISRVIYARRNFEIIPL